jgi:hypothetical protein
VRLIEQGARVVSGIRISVTIERATNSRFTIARRIGPAGTSVSSRYYSGFTAKIAKKRNSLLPRSRFERNMWCFKNKVTFRPGVYDEYRIASCFALIGRDDKPHSALFDCNDRVRDGFRRFADVRPIMSGQKFDELAETHSTFVGL